MRLWTSATTWLRRRQLPHRLPPNGRLPALPAASRQAELAACLRDPSLRLARSSLISTLSHYDDDALRVLLNKTQAPMEQALILHYHRYVRQLFDHDLPSRP